MARKSRKPKTPRGQSGKRGGNRSNKGVLDTITGTWTHEGKMINPYSEEEGDMDPYGKLTSDRLINGRYTAAETVKGEDSFIFYQDINGNSIFDASDKQFGTAIISDAALKYLSRGLEPPIPSDFSLRTDRWELQVTSKGASGKIYDDGFHSYDLTVTDLSVFS